MINLLYHLCVHVCVAPVHKAHHPTGVILKVEADARLIKTYKAGQERITHPASRKTTKTEKGKTVLIKSRSSLKSQKSKATQPPSQAPPKSVTQKTAQAVSHSPSKGRRFGAKLKPSSLPPKSVTHKTSSAVSRNLQKGWYSETTLTPSPYSLKGVTKTTTAAQSRSLHRHWSSVTQSLETTQVLKHSLIEALPKRSQVTRLYTSPNLSPVKLSARTVTVNVLPTAERSLKTEALPQKSTVLLMQNRSETSTNAFLNTTVKLEPSSQVKTRNIKTTYSTGPRPSSSLSSTIHSYVQTLPFHQSAPSNDQNVNSRETASKTDDLNQCKKSKISKDISLPSGTAIALGPVPDMRTCIHLSCDVGGDVAYMRSLQCFVITCDSVMCEPRQIQSGNTSADITSQVAFLSKKSQSVKGRLLFFNCNFFIVLLRTIKN